MLFSPKEHGVVSAAFSSSNVAVECHLVEYRIAN
jgi:hypothetical protein